MILIIVVASTLTFIFVSTEIFTYGALKVMDHTQFPIFSDQLFHIFFTPRVGDFPTFSVLVFIVRDGIRILERIYFYPGFFKELEYPFLGKMLELQLVTVHSNRSISVRAKFNENSNWRQFEVRYGEYVSRDKMNYAKANFWLHTGVLYSRTIQLNIRTKLVLNTLTVDGRTDGVIIEEPSYLVCRGSHGYPLQSVTLLPGYRHNIIHKQYDPFLNEQKFKVLFNLKDHGSQYECKTTDAFALSHVNVFHHPTKLRLEPAYYNSVPNGSAVKCVADDGYPYPKISWYFMRGPVNADWYFNVYHDQLVLLRNAPIGSEWIFKCVAENVIPYSGPNTTALVFKFSVIHSSYRQLVLIASSSATVLCVVTIILVIVVIFHPHRSILRHQLPKEEPPLPQELAFDQDTEVSVSDCEHHNDVPRYVEIDNGDNFATVDVKSTSTNRNSVSYV